MKTLECADMSALWSDATCRVGRKRCQATAVQTNSEIIGQFKLVGLEAFHSFHKRGRSGSREPRGGTPFVIFRQRHDTVFGGIGMDVMQPREIRALKRDVAVPILKPHFASGCGILSVQFLRGFHVQLADKLAQGRRLRRRNGDEVIMIRQNRPSAQSPVEFTGVSKQRFEEKIQTLRGVQVREFLISARRDHVNARLEEPVCGRVRPVHGQGFSAAERRCGQAYCKTLECTGVSALWNDATCRVGESGVKPPQSTFGGAA